MELIDLELGGFYFGQFTLFSSFFKGQYLGIYLLKKGKKLQAFYYNDNENDNENSLF